MANHPGGVSCFSPFFPTQRDRIPKQIFTYTLSLYPSSYPSYSNYFLPVVRLVPFWPCCWSRFSLLQSINKRYNRYQSLVHAVGIWSTTWPKGYKRLIWSEKDYTPGRLTWNLKTTQLKRKIIFQTIIFRFHLNIPGCRWNSVPPMHRAGARIWWIVRYEIRSVVKGPTCPDW